MKLSENGKKLSKGFYMNGIHISTRKTL